jgi:hypothetical protein
MGLYEPARSSACAEVPVFPAIRRSGYTTCGGCARLERTRRYRLKNHICFLKIPLPAMSVLGSLLLLAGSTHAQLISPRFLPLDPRPTAQALDPQSPVPKAVYVSSFANLPSGVETNLMNWRKANDDVGQFTRGHIDLLKLEQTGPTPAPQSPAKAGAKP